MKIINCKEVLARRIQKNKYGDGVGTYEEFRTITVPPPLEQIGSPRLPHVPEYFPLSLVRLRKKHSLTFKIH